MREEEDTESVEPAPAAEGPRDFTSGSLASAIWTLSAPMALDQVITSGYRLVDLYFLGQLGAVVLAASSLGSMAAFTVLTGSLGVAVAGLAVVARRVGERDSAGASHALWQILMVSAVAGVILGALGALATRPLLTLLGAEDEVLEVATRYLRVTFLLLPCLVLNLATNRALRGAGEARTALWTMASGTALSVALCPFLITGVGPVAGLGVVGSALASAAGQTVSFAAAMVVLFRGRLRVALRLREARPDPAIMLKILRVGAPVTGQLLLRSTSRLVLAPLIASFGPAALAAYGIVVRVMMFPLSIGFGLGNAAGTLVGQSLGAGKPRRAAVSAWSIAGVNVSLMGICVVSLVLWAPELVRLLVREEGDVVVEGVRVIRILAPSYLFAALGVVMGRSFDGAGDTVPAMWVNLLTLWLVQVPLAYLLALWLDLGTTGVWAGLACANVLNGVIFALWFLGGRWKQRAV